MDFHEGGHRDGGNQFQDVSGEAPDDEEWARAQDPQLEDQPSIRQRILGKRPGAQRDTESGEPVAPPAQRPRQQDNEQMALFAEKWQERVPGESWGSQPVEFWMQHNAAVALERHRARQTTEV